MKRESARVAQRHCLLGGSGSRGDSDRSVC